MDKIKEDVGGDVAGFADASATNSNYQVSLSPTEVAKAPKKGKKMKTVKEAYNRKIVKKDKIDARVADPKLMGKQAKDMLATGKTVPVEEAKKPRFEIDKEVDLELSKRFQKKLRNSGTSGKDMGESKSHFDLVSGKHTNEMTPKQKKDFRNRNRRDIYAQFKSKHNPWASSSAVGRDKAFEEIITDFSQVLPILESYTPSLRLQSRTHHLVKPNLSKKLQARLAARKNQEPKQKAVVKEPKIKTKYKPSAQTLSIAAARKTQMSSHINPASEASVKMIGASLGEGKTSNELKKFTGSSGKMKRKYLGKTKGRTATGKPAHPIEVDPIIGVDNRQLSQAVK